MPFDETAAQHAHRLFAAVVTPPPVNGMTLVSQHLLGALGADGAGVTQPDWLASQMWPAWRHLGLAQRLWMAGRAAKPGDSLYFVPDAGRGLILNAAEARLMRRFDRIVLHHHVFSYIRDYDPRFARFRAQLGNDVSHIMLSQTMGTHMSETYGLDDRIHVLGNSGIVRSAIRTSPRNHLRCIGFLANITRDKGIAAFLDTARAVTTRHPGILVQIAGPVAEPALRAELKAFITEAPKTRCWLGAVSGAAKAQFLSEIDLLLFPTRYANEAQPLVIFEALASGTPVLATPRGCIPDQLGRTDWLLPQVGFVEAARPMITNWIAQPDSFAHASLEASAIFAAHLTRDRAALRQLQIQFAGVR